MNHIRKYNEGLSYSEYRDICLNTPKFYPVFVITQDYDELYTNENITIKKGTELYVVDR